MTTALSRVLRDKRALYNSSHTMGRMKASTGAGLLSMLGGGMDMSHGHSINRGANTQRYALYRGWVHAAVNAIAKKAASQPVNVGRMEGKHQTPKQGTKAAEREFQILPDHPLTASLDRPNSMQSRWQFVYSFVANLNLTGWSFVISDNESGEHRFYSIPTTWVEPIHQDYPFSHFKIINPRNPRIGEDQTILDRSQVSFAYVPNPGDPFTSLAPAQAQQAAIKIDEHIQSSQSIFFENGIFPSVLITIGQNPNPTPGATPPRS